ncbi:TonB-dependent receptor [uncultured Tenacibaculum sp.]|uniref:TonB-dependent receptor n=1 Tax=uncultured Tenacibaculum sp. TaxID=174713 RepID=UPI00260A38BE|nr:TonB-dependent receptor [uncultured Tenacibaculum sp.]
MIKNSILTIVFLCLINYTFSQEKFNVSYNKTSLQQVIVDLESKTNIIFSYSKEVIHKKQITLTKQTTTIKNIISDLTQQTGLLFEILSNNQVIISKARKICGYVVDASTNETLPFTNVVINDKLYKTTNENGFFSFENPPKNSEKITLSLLGYQDKEITLNTSEECITIPLYTISSELDEVIILGYITSGIDRNKDGSISVDSKRLGILPGLVSPDIAQSIQLIPGISTLDESATGIQIRGGSPDQNLILYDNIKLYNTGYFYGMFSLFNPFATQKATVFRSGTSANYGDRISGIIDISSGSDIPKKNEGGFEIDGLSINGYLKTPLSEKVGLYFFARRSYSDVIQTPTYNSYADKIFTNFGIAKDINGNILDLETDDDFSRKTSNNNFTFSDYSTKLIIKPNEKNSIAVSALYTRNSLDFDFNSIEEKSVDDLITINKGFSLNWKHITNKKQQEELTAYYSEYDSFYKNDELEDETGNGSLDLTKISIRENNIVDLGLNFSLHKQLNEHQKLKLGYQLSNTNLLVDIRKIKPFETNENERKLQDINNFKNALFGEYIYSFANNGFINAGVRFVNYSSLNRFLVEPRINFEYPITNSLRFKTAIERRNQPISQLVEFDNIELRLENNLWRLSDNKQFPLLSSDQISGGLLYRYKKLSIDVDAYYKELKGLTTFTSGFSNPLENLEQGNSTIKGLDLLLKYKWNNYKIWAGYTFNDITFQFPNLPNTPSSFSGNNDIKHQFRISNTLQLNKWQFSLGWQIRNGKPITPVNSYEIKIDADGEKAGVVNFGSINSSRLPNFHRLDASVLYDFKIKTGNKKLNAQFGISVLNLYNRVRPLNLIYKAERKPLDDGGIAVPGTTGSSPEELELILEQVIQRSSLGLTPNAVFRIHF